MSLDQLQSTPPLGPGDAVVFSDRALYQTYNFHDPDAVERLAAWLARDEESDGSGVAVVAGRPGTGRDYLVRAAAWLAGERGPRVRHARLSFDGFDPDHHASLTAFADHQLRLQFAPTDRDLPRTARDRQAALLELAGSLPASFLGAAGIAFLARAAFSLVDIKALLRSTVLPLAGPNRSAEEHLRAILDFATRADRLVLVLPADEIPEPALQWFVHEPRRNHRLSVMLLTARPPETPQFYGEPLAHVVELRQMTQDALRERVNHRFTPNEFPDRFFSGLWKRTQGVRGQVALAMMDLERRELITRGDRPGRPWRLAVEADDERLVEYFASHFYDRLNQIRNQHDPMDLHVVRFVELAALCGSIVPPRLIASYMGLTDDERDDLLDRLDELQDEGSPVFTSFDYQHPTFRNEHRAPELVYRFGDESHRLIVIRRMVQKSREAKGLLQYLASRVPVITRGNAELFASLAAHLENGSEEREEYDRRLRWWTDAEEAEALTEILCEQLRSGEMSLELLWATASAREEWPNGRRLALLQAVLSARDGIPLSVLPYVHELHATLLFREGKYRDSLRALRGALDTASPSDFPLLLTLHSALYFCTRALNMFEESLRYAREARRLALQLHGRQGPHATRAASQVASALLMLGRRDEARELVDEVLDSISELRGDPGLVALLMSELGVALNQLGDYEGATLCFREALLADEQILAERGGDRVEHAVSLFNLGASLRSSGGLDEAYDRLTAAAAAFVAGPGHPAFGGALLHLVALDLQRGNHEGASAWAQQLRELVAICAPDVVAHLRLAAGKLVQSEEQRGYETPEEMLRLLPFLLESVSVNQDAPVQA